MLDGLNDASRQIMCAFYEMVSVFQHLPLVFPQNPNFGGRPMYFQLGAFRALRDRPIERMSRLIAQTTRVREFFHVHGVEM